MKVTHDGLTLWYGTPDAPAPLQEVAPRIGATLTVGASPPSPSNSVQVRYRVDGGIPQLAPGRELHTDYARGAQYFSVTFPSFPTGQVVEYCPILGCAGRQVPSASAADRFPARFDLGAPAPRALRPAPRSRRQTNRQRFGLDLTYLATVVVDFEPPQVVGETPEGVRVDFIARGGSVVGPTLNGRVTAGSSDHMFVRPDGVGMIRVRAVVATDDGAMLEVENNGSVEFGEDGYERALTNRLPDGSPLVLCPRFLTGHPKYKWLNRLQCFGAGKTRLAEAKVEYDLFAPTPKVLGAQP